MTAFTLAGRVGQAKVIRSEWTKFRSLRSSWWTLAVAVALTVGLGVLVSYAAAGEDGASGAPNFVAARSELGGVFAELALGVLGILLISGEYGTGMIRASMAAVPKRLPVLWGKVAVFVALALPISLVAAFVAFWLGQVVWRGEGRAGVDLGDPEVLRIVVGTGLYLTVAGVFALGLGALLRNSATGITVLVGLNFVLPTVAQALPHSLNEASRFLPANAGASLANQSLSDNPLAPWPGFLLLCGYTVVVLAAAGWRLRRTDV
jgi:ABC-2 type transport system permease protein